MLNIPSYFLFIYFLAICKGAAPTGQSAKLTVVTLKLSQLKTSWNTAVPQIWFNISLWMTVINPSGILLVADANSWENNEDRQANVTARCSATSCYISYSSAGEHIVSDGECNNSSHEILFNDTLFFSYADFDSQRISSALGNPTVVSVHHLSNHVTFACANKLQQRLLFHLSQSRFAGEDPKFQLHLLPHYTRLHAARGWDAGGWGCSHVPCKRTSPPSSGMNAGVLRWNIPDLHLAAGWHALPVPDLPIDPAEVWQFTVKEYIFNI